MVMQSVSMCDKVQIIIYFGAYFCCKKTYTMYVDYSKICANDRTMIHAPMKR